MIEQSVGFTLGSESDGLARDYRHHFGVSSEYSFVKKPNLFERDILQDIILGAPAL